VIVMKNASGILTFFSEGVPACCRCLRNSFWSTKI